MVSSLRQQKDQERKERTRDALLDAAAVVFVRKGYHGSLISEIVAEVGVGQGTFYRHFPNKRAIIDALFERFVQTLLAEFAVMSATPPTDAESYRVLSIAALRGAVRAVEDRKDLARMFLREGPAIDLEFEQRLADVFDQFAAVARFFLELAVSGGFARPCDTEIVAQCIVGLGLHQLQLDLRGRLGERTLDDVAVEVVDMVFLGIGPTTQESG